MLSALEQVDFFSPEELGISVEEGAESEGVAASRGGYPRKFKLASKLKALEILGKNLGELTDKVDINVQVKSMEQVLEDTYLDERDVTPDA
jgi:hypothetical protein